MEEPTVKELRSDDNDPLFDKTNMLKKEFPSDFRQIRYFTLLIVQSAPSEIRISGLSKIYFMFKAVSI